MRRMPTLPIATLCLAFSGALSGAVAVPAGAMPVGADGPGGFSTVATATPVKLEIYEPAIPIPASPQAELSLSYSNVEATSGPTATARASTLWPGDPVGEGLKTIGEQAGLPPQLTANGYPVQANAQTPGTPAHASQQPLPGMVSRADADSTTAVAQAGYDSDGTVDEAPEGGSAAGSGDGSGGGAAALPDPGEVLGSDLTGSLLGGDLTGSLTGSLLGGLQRGTGGPSAVPPSGPSAADPPSPLGALSGLVDAGTASSISRATYAGPTVVASATSTLADVKLLGGIIRFGSITTHARTQSDLGGARSTGGTTYTGLSIAGTPFTVTRDGVRASGQQAPIPGLPDNAARALAALGVSMSLPEPEVSRDGVQSSIDALGIEVTIDTGVLRSKLPSLPIGQLTSGMPDSAKQLKGLLLALNEAHPELVLHLGEAHTQAVSVPPVSFDFPQGATGGGPSLAGGTGAAGVPGAGAGGSTGGPAGAGAVGATAPVGGTGGAAAGSPVQVANVSSTPGLPKLGTVPGLLTVGGLVLAGLAGWGMRRAGLLVLGGAASCAHGLASGVPDLRKAAP